MQTCARDSVVSMGEGVYCSDRFPAGGSGTTEVSPLSIIGSVNRGGMRVRVTSKRGRNKKSLGAAKAKGSLY